MHQHDTVDALLEELYAKGCEHDSGTAVRSKRMLNITPSTGRFLDLMVEECLPRRILEIGTSNGYSTIWLARVASRCGALVVSIDVSTDKIEAADRHLTAAGLRELVTLHAGDAGEYLRECLPESFDMIFLDCDRSRYCQWAPDLFRVIQFGTLIVDNATSHPDEMRDFRTCVDHEPSLESVVLPIGKGQLVVRKRASESRHSTN
jgi:predicted O-methyltransferase YrrM